MSVFTASAVASSAVTASQAYEFLNRHDLKPVDSDGFLSEAEIHEHMAAIARNKAKIAKSREDASWSRWATGMFKRKKKDDAEKFHDAKSTF